MPNETIDDVLAELLKCASLTVRCGKCSEQTDVYLIPRGMLDRLAAVAKREIRAERTDAIDEALAHAEEVREAKCRECVSAPARNVDRPECRTRDDARKVFERESAGMWAADWDAAFTAWLFYAAQGGSK